MSTLNKEKTSVISNLRACLISAKGGIRVSSLNHDYQQLVGEPIPSRKFGFKTVEEFLRTIPNITIITKGGESYVQAQASESSAHITSLVNEQKSDKRKTKLPGSSRSVVRIRQNKPPRFRRRGPIREAPAPPRRSPIKKIHSAVGGRLDNNNEDQDDRNIPKKEEKIIPQKKYSQATLMKLNNEDRLNRQHSIPSDIYTGRQHSTPSENKSVPTSPMQAECPTLEYKLSKLANSLPQYKQVPLTIDTSSTSTNKANMSPNNSYGSYRSPTSPTIKQAGAPPKVSKTSAQDRLARVKLSQSERKHINVDHQEGEKGSFFHNQLLSYLKKLNCSCEPEYLVTRPKSSGRARASFFAVVRITIPRMSNELPDEVIDCSNLANDFSNPIEAKENAAKLALEQLQERERFANLPVLSKPEAIINCLEQAVEKKEHGIWAEHFEDDFKVSQKKLLPPYWLEIVRMSSKFDVVETGKSWVIKAKDETPSGFSPTVLTMPALRFPPGNTWDVFITGGKSVNAINLRFIGDEYSALFDKFCSDMEEWYSKKEHLIQPLLIIGENYVAHFENSWWRVRVITIEIDRIKVKFIDHGDEDYIPRASLYNLDSRFFKLPPQAISVSLKDLEDFSERMDAEDFIFKTIVGKSLVALHDKQPNNISVLLFDTSYEEALNLNENLRQLFELDYKRPLSFEVGSIHDVFLGDINVEGIVYVSIVSEAYSLLLDFLELTEQNYYEGLKDPSELDTSKIYFVYKDNQYIRAQAKTTNFIDGKVEVFYIDYGTSDNVFLEDIANVEEISYILANIPGQAIPILLHEIPPKAITPGLRERLIQLACSEDPQPVLVGSVKDMCGDVPVFELFMRMPPNDHLVSLNKIMILESGLNMSNITQKFHNMSMMQHKKKNRAHDLLANIISDFPLYSTERIINENRPPLPDLNEDFDIYVLDTASPSHFLINPQDYVSSLNNMMEEMNAYYNKCTIKSKITEGAFCAAKDGDFWYRVYIDKVIDSENVSVKVLDYGCMKIISTSNMRPLLDVFKKHPYIGFCAKIYGINPIHGDWSVEDCILLKKVINKKKLRARLRSIVISKSSLGGITLCLQLFITDTKTGYEIDIADFLIEQTHAYRG